jgi:hypothetical protein
MDRLTPSLVGARAELAVATGLLRAGYDVYTPFFSAHSRVDLVACRSSEVLRLQVKNGRVKSGAVQFRTCSNTGQVHVDYRGEVDAFGVYCPELGLVYLVPIDAVPLRDARLRLEPARNGQHRGVRWAEDYCVGPV